MSRQRVTLNTNTNRTFRKALYLILFLIVVVLRVHFGGRQLRFTTSLRWQQNVKNGDKQNSTPSLHHSANIFCDAYGGPANEVAAEMIYWRNVPSDANLVSPYKKKNENQYLSFEPCT
jgi:hypothetical protein